MRLPQLLIVLRKIVKREIVKRQIELSSLSSLQAMGLRQWVVLSGCFILSLTLCLYGGNGFAVEGGAPDTLVEQGVERYRAGDFQGAIAPWQEALNLYQSSDALANQAIVSENLARAYRQLGSAEDSLPYWTDALSLQQQLNNYRKVGQLLTEQAQTYSRLGQYQQAVTRLCSEVTYRVARSDRESSSHLSCGAGSAVGIAQAVGDRLGETAALGSLGEVRRLQGRYELAEQALNQSLSLAQSLNHHPYMTAAAQSLANLFTQRSDVSDRRRHEAQARGDRVIAQQQEQLALDYAQKALDFSQQSLDAARANPEIPAIQPQIQGLLSMTVLHHRLGNLNAARTSHREAIALLNQLPDSRDKVYVTIELADALPLTWVETAVPSSNSTVICQTSSSGQDIGTDHQEFDGRILRQQEILLMQAASMATRIDDYRAQSFALGKLGHLYECQQDYGNALRTTHQAEWAADQDLKSPDSLYLWQWQVGRIFKRQGNTAGAIATYEKAVNTLEKIRSGIVTANRDLQFDFRDAVEPVYRELADLRLSQAPESTVVSSDNQETTENINAALTAIDSLKLAELQNYFGDDCLILASIAPDDMSAAVKGATGLDRRYNQTGVLSTFISNERTAVVLSLPDGQQRVEWLNIGEMELQQQVTDFRLELQNSLNYLRQYDPRFAQPLYDELIRPFLPDLEQADIKTLVFVQDGMFRSVPMAALYDGDRQQYLIEQYAIATTPSLSLTTLSQPRKRPSPKVLALGLTQQKTVKGRNWPPLSGVKRELDQITALLPGSQQFLDETFTRDRLRQALKEEDYSVIHLATHGEFGAEPKDTFLITGDGQILTIGELETAIRQSRTAENIDLLTLTACKTAVGDNRSTLGLAGVAVQAGVRSAIASLWAINDTSTAELMKSFYQSLNQPEVTKAKALQAAQLSLLQRDDLFSRPGFWAPFVLVGDWQ